MKLKIVTHNSVQHWDCDKYIITDIALDLYKNESDKYFLHIPKRYLVEVDVIIGNDLTLDKYKVYYEGEEVLLNLKSMYRDRLRRLQEFIKITKLSEEFGLKYNTLSAFLKSEKNDSMVSEEKLHDLCLYIDQRILELIR